MARHVLFHNPLSLLDLIADLSVSPLSEEMRQYHSVANEETWHPIWIRLTMLELFELGSLVSIQLRLRQSAGLRELYEKQFVVKAKIKM